MMKLLPYLAQFVPSVDFLDFFVDSETLKE